MPTQTPPSRRAFIKDLEANKLVEGVYAIQNCQIGQTKAGKPFIKCLIADKTGRTPGRMWNATEELFSTLPTDGFVWISAQSQPYQGEMQLIIQQIEKATPSPVELADLLPCSKYDPEEMFAEVTKVMESLTHPAIKALAKQYLDDTDLMDRFKRAPAAMTLHHAYISGLLEHTLSLLRLAQAVLPLYPQLNRDIVLMGLLLHDMGKCTELTWETGFGYSDDGQLVGHVARGVIWLQRKAEDCAALGQKVPEPVLRVLHHIILSHHGKAEFGALKIPATAEAIAVSLMDNMDAKLHMAIVATRGESEKAAELGGNFTEKVWALETRLYRPDPTTVEEK
ncbi:MAG: HD domain-containing protein [Planctomycetes bacterium]|nr:HD domain-containing protein [Planctomycetota bacterium]